MKILISNCYSYQNKGDAAIILCMIDHIKEQYNNCEITLSVQDTNDYGKYGDFNYQKSILTLINELLPKKGYSLINRLVNNIIIKSIHLNLKIFSYFTKFKIYLYLILPSTIKSKIKTYENFDLVIAAGGGYLISKGPSNKLEKVLGIDMNVMFCYDFFFANFFRRPYILYNQSIGPFYKDSDFLRIKPFLEGANKIILRENISYKRLEKYGLMNIIESNDVAFNLHPKKCEILDNFSYNDKNLNVGLTVRKCLSPSEQEKYELAITNVIIYLIEKFSANIFFMPQVIIKELDDDIAVSNFIKSKIPEIYQQYVNILNYDVHPSELKYVIGKMNYFIGTRFHSCIFALSSRVKTIAIAYEPKTDGIMQKMGLSEFVLHADTLKGEELASKFELLIKNDTYLDILENGLSIVKNNKESLIIN